MKKIFLTLMVSLSLVFAHAQGNDSVRILVSQGIQLHDKGDFEGAIKKYDEALAINKFDYDANYEKSFSCYRAARYDECISISKFIIEQLPENIDKVAVYSNYGSALDDKGESEKAVAIYNEGIQKYPTHYLLYFNKGLTLTRMNRKDDALLSYQKALEMRPLHPSSNYYTGVVLQYSNKIPALLSTLVFLAVEPGGERAKQAFERTQEIMYGNIKKDDDNHTTITINSGLLDKKNIKNENDFSMVEMMMSLLFVSASDKKTDSLDNAEKLSLQLGLLVSSLSENRREKNGFYWKFYVPFFIALKDKDYMPVFAHIVFTSKNDGPINEWLRDNKDKVEEFYFWLQNYKWTL